jgi:hypothetical protein
MEFKFRKDISSIICQQWGSQMQPVREEIEAEFPDEDEIRVFRNGDLDKSFSINPLFDSLFLDELETLVQELGYEHLVIHISLEYTRFSWAAKGVTYSNIFFEGRCISRSFYFLYDAEKKLEFHYSKGCEENEPLYEITFRDTVNGKIIRNIRTHRETMADILRIGKEFPYIYHRTDDGLVFKKNG